MGWRVVEQPNKKLAVFSSIVDDFIAINCTRADVTDIFVEAAVAEAKRAAERVLAGSLAGFTDCVLTIETAHGAELAEERRAECFVKEPEDGHTRR